MRTACLLLYRLRHLQPRGFETPQSLLELHNAACRAPPHRPSPAWPRLQHSAALDSDQDDERRHFSEKVLRLRDEIAGLSDEELVAMSAGLRKVLGLPEPPPMGSMPAGGMLADWQEGNGEAVATATEEKAPEKTTFSVKLEKYEAASKIKVIKEVRAVTSLGLKEAKEFVEKVPGVVKAGMSKDEASQLVEKLKAAGATAVIE